jgi:hypothetical protein
MRAGIAKSMTTRTMAVRRFAPRPTRVSIIAPL